MGGLAMRRCTSVAPASRSIRTMRREVVPRTTESSMSTIRWPRTMDLTAESFIRTPFSRSACEGWMKVRAMYLFLIRPIS